MDTGFRRYDGSLMPIRRPNLTYTCIFKGNTKSTKVEIFLLRNLLVLRGEKGCFLFGWNYQSLFDDVGRAQFAQLRGAQAQQISQHIVGMLAQQRGVVADAGRRL
jgi:hypothetical protein